MLELAPHLAAALSAGQTVVVPTAQRAAALRLAYATRQLAAGHRAFRTPDVDSLNGWLRGQPAAVAPDGRARRRLGAAEEWLLWRAAVGGAAAQLSLPMVPGLVEAVRQSARVLFEWRIDPAAVRAAGTPEGALLAESLTAIDARLVELSATASWRALQDLAADPPRRVPVFAGFGYATPARRALLVAWAQQGRAARELTHAFADAPAALASAVDPAAELALVAQWCRERLRAAPAARLLVIVPDLARRHTEVRRVFDAALDPGYLNRGATEDSTAYALEGGQPLLSYAPVTAGVGMLRLLISEVELAQVSQWLRDGFWVQPDAASRARLDVWLRTALSPRLNARQLLSALRGAPPTLLAHADEVAAVIARQLDVLSPGSRAGLGLWSERFAQVLANCGFNPGAARQRTSHTQQVLQRLDELLQECAAVPATLGIFTAAEALSVLAQLFGRTRFEPATGDPAVTLTASLADPIVRYDGIWVSGLHAGGIPERARFDPFIPVALQRQAGFHAADAAALVDQARHSLATLCCSGREFIVSAPTHAADLELTRSPLLAPYAAQSYAPPRGDVELSRVIRAARQLESYADETGAPWPVQLPLPAGTRAIELQSRCPFRAYAQLRLGAQPMEVSTPGITPRERGRMLHRALELLWRRLAGSAGLSAARSAQSLSQSIAESVAQAASEILSAPDPDSVDEAYAPAADATGLLALRRAAISRETARAGRLIGTLCELEASRAEFVVHELETAHRAQIGTALIDVRIDRIDRLEDGSFAILDYKSGRAQTPGWDVARTTHPQLLVYLLAAGVPVSALAVAHLDPKSVVFKGIGDREGRLPGVAGVGAPAAASLAAADSWAQQLSIWRDQVGRLAGDFVRGEARVDPMDGACDYCHLHAFCRIADLEPRDQVDVTDDSGE